MIAADGISFNTNGIYDHLLNNPTDDEQCVNSDLFDVFYKIIEKAINFTLTRVFSKSYIP